MRKSKKRIALMFVAIILSFASVYAHAEDRIHIPIQSQNELLPSSQNDNGGIVEILLFQDKSSTNNQLTVRVTNFIGDVKYCVPTSIEGKHYVVTTDSVANATFSYGNRTEYRVYYTKSFDLIFTPNVGNVKYYYGEVKLDFYDGNDQWIDKKVISVVMDTLTGEYSAFYLKPY